MENQFKVSITQHIENIYGLACEEFAKADKDFKENPRSHSAKAEWSKRLAEKQVLNSLLHHIDKGHYDSEEFYTMYLNPQTRFKQ